MDDVATRLLSFHPIVKIRLPVSSTRLSPSQKFSNNDIDNIHYTLALSSSVFEVRQNPGLFAGKLLPFRRIYKRRNSNRRSKLD